MVCSHFCLSRALVSSGITSFMPLKIPQKRSHPARKLASCKVFPGGHEQRCKTENSAVGGDESIYKDVTEKMRSIFYEKVAGVSGQMCLSSVSPTASDIRFCVFIPTCVQTLQFGVCGRETICRLAKGDKKNRHCRKRQKMVYYRIDVKI